MSPDSKLNGGVTGNAETRDASPPESSDEVGGTSPRPVDVEISGTPTGAGNKINSPSIVRKPAGPRTTAGKKKSARNSTKLGIFANVALLPDESRAQFNFLWRGLRKAFQPVGTFEEALVEKMAVNLWMQRRVLIGEIAGIEEVRRGYVIRSDEQAPTSKTVHLLVHYAGREDHKELMERTPNPELSARDRCIQLLDELATGIHSTGFESSRDMKILAKLYGSANDDNQRNILIASYHTWQPAASRSEEERVRTGSASPRECVENFIKDVEAEIDRLGCQKSVEVDRVQLQRLRQVVPDSDYSLRRITTLERSFDRLVAQLERHRRMRLGQPVLPQIEVHHSVSHD